MSSLVVLDIVGGGHDVSGVYMEYRIYHRKSLYVVISNILSIQLDLV